MDTSSLHTGKKTGNIFTGLGTSKEKRGKLYRWLTGKLYRWLTGEMYSTDKVRLL